MEQQCPSCKKPTAIRIFIGIAEREWVCDACYRMQSSLILRDPDLAERLKEDAFTIDLQKVVWHSVDE